MKAKDFLRKWEHLNTKRKNKLIEIAMWEDIAHSITAPMGGERVQSSKNPSKMADAVDACIDMIKEINGIVLELSVAMRKITNVIEQLNPTEYDVLHMKYMQGKSYYEIADAKKKDYSWVTTVHGRGLKNVQKIIDKRADASDDT